MLAFLVGQRINFSKNEWKVICIFGICQNAIYLGLNFLAMKWIDAGIGAVIASTLPILVVGRTNLGQIVEKIRFGSRARIRA